MLRVNGKGVRYHFEGVRGKVGQMRELVEVIDQMFDSFTRVNEISKEMLFRQKEPRKEIDHGF